MNISNHIKLIVIGSAALLLASCSSLKNSMIEPEAYIQYDKEEFDYSPQVTGEATVVKILMVDWSRLFSTQKGEVSSASSSLFGLSPNSDEEHYALHNLMSNNPGYDFIVYPQYEISTKAPGLGLFYKKTQVKATARLASTNDFITVEGSGITPKTKEMKAALAALQTAYDSLVEEVSDMKNDYATKETELKTQIQDATEKQHITVTPSHRLNVNESENNASTVTPPVSTASTVIPPLSSTKMTTSSKVKTVAGTYSLIVGSYSNSENAERAVANLNKKYPDLIGRVGIVIAGEKFRIGFINFKTRNDAIIYKNNLIKKYPEFKDAWPFRP